MDLKTVKSCFEKYIRYLETMEKLYSCENFDIDNISIQDIDRMTQILFMNYIIKCDSKIHPTNIPCILYKHVNSLICQYIQDESNKTIPLLKDHVFQLEDDNNKLKQDLSQNLEKYNMLKTPDI